MQLTYRGSVNRWECDENDHLNVRFCEQKLYQTLLSGLLEHHCLTREDIGRLPAMILRQHIRFQAESRIAAPLGGYFSAVASDEFQVLVELRNEATGAVACSMLCDMGTGDIAVRLKQLGSSLAPEDIAYAWPRGITANVALHHLTPNQATELGFRTIGAGVLEGEECTDAGLLLPYHCMIFNPQTQRCQVCAQAVALRMDLKARKAITMDEDALGKLRAQQIKLP